MKDVEVSSSGDSVRKAFLRRRCPPRDQSALESTDGTPHTVNIDG